MIKWFVGGVKRALGLHRPGRNLDVFPDDVYLVSYPKSGNTWTRFLIANLAFPEAGVDFKNINELTPDPEALSKRKLLTVPRPRIIKSHQYFDPRYPKVIYIVRDPRDVLLSQYHFAIKRRLIPDDFPIKEYLPRFLGKDQDHNYGNWRDNVASWFYLRRNNPDFLLIRYEDLLSDGKQQLARIADFLGLPQDAHRIESALQRSSAERMRELEKKQALSWSSTKETRQDLPFVRAAAAGGWKQELPADCVAALELAWGDLMKQLGYEVNVATAVEIGAR